MGPQAGHGRDRGQDDPAEAGMSTDGGARCHVCQRPVSTRWHCADGRYLDRAECRATGGIGVWLCGTCEDAAHRYMRSTGADGREAVEELFARLERLLGGPARRYTREGRN
ncbi:hypothetical protein GCM10022203_21460 [Micrococcus yunnanensis]